jgi:hypothetical protein
VSRKWAIGSALAVAAIAAAVAAGAVFGGGTPSRPDYATVDVKLERVAGAAGLSAKPAKKPKLIYLQGQPSTVDVDSTGPNIDVRISPCPGSSRVIDGGVFPDNTNVFQQGTYVPSGKEYHVLIGFDDPALQADFQLSSHLICLKGVK